MRERDRLKQYQYEIKTDSKSIYVDFIAICIWALYFYVVDKLFYYMLSYLSVFANMIEI